MVKNQDPNHVIQSGPYAGKTVKQKREMKAAKQKVSKNEGKANKKGIKTGKTTIIMRAPSTPLRRSENIEEVVSRPELIKEVTALVEAILLQNRPYVLPRPCGNFVAPHQFSWQKTFQLDTVAKLKTSLLFSNNLDNILSIGQPVTGATTVPGNSWIISPNATTVPLSIVCIDASLTTGDKQMIKASGLNMPAGYAHYSNSQSRFVPGFKYYPGVVTTMPTTDISFYNSAGIAGNLQILAGNVSGGEPITIISHAIPVASGPAIVTYDLSTDANWAGFQAAVGAGSQGFWFGFSWSTPNGNQFESYGFNYSLTFKANLVITSPIVWTRYPLWELMSDGIVPLIQYQKSSRHNVTGNIVTLTNNTSDLIKGGSIFAARLPGNTYSELGGSVDDIISVISSQVHHKLVSPELKKGMSYSFTPEKLQDWLFERDVSYDPFNGNPENLPYCAVALDATNSGLNNGNPVFTITGTISVEYLTTDPSNWFVSSPSSGPLFDAILNAIAVENCVSCNPDHFDHLKGVVKRVMTSDNLKYALKTMISAGVKVAPFVLSLL